jgi:CheY-like chemotaxis protein
MIEDEAGPSLPADAMRDLGSIQAVGQKLVALIETHLGESKKSAAELDLPRAQFEFRVLLNDVAGYASMLRDDAIEADCSDLVADLGKVIKAESNLLALVEEELSSGADTRLARSVESDPFEQSSGDDTIANDVNSAPLPALGEGGEILIVDDDPTNRDLLTRRLSSQGYRPMTAESGQDALAQLRDHRPDLVLLDLVMPEMDGLEVLGRMQDDASLRSIPVIMLSAADRPNDVVRCIAQGAEEFVPKPFNPILLRARIGAVLEKVRLRASLARQITVFVSSPGDVIPERRVVKQVITDLNEEFAGRAILVPMMWEEEPLLASDTFQAQIRSAAEADIYLGIFWSRIGSMLPETLKRPDGSRYESGTAFELEQALVGHGDTGHPDVLVYRKDGAPTMSLESPEAVIEQLDQMKRLADYLEHQFMEADGSYRSAFHTFGSPEQFETAVTGHLRKLVERHIEDSDVSGALLTG